MFEDMYTKSNSIAKNLLACVSVLFLMAGCGAYDVSKSNNDNNAMTKSGSPETGSPEITLSSNIQTIDSGDSVTLSWSSSDTSECTASGDWTGTRAVSGSWLITSLMSDSTFNLSCSGVAGTVSDSVSVTVNSVSAPSPPPSSS